MFVCAEHHDARCHGLELRSRGPCESCGALADTWDCHYLSPEARFRIDRKMAELGYHRNPRTGRFDG